MSFENIVSRVLGMSAPAIWAFIALLIVIFCAGGWIYREYLKNRKDGEPFDLQMPFLRLKSGHTEDHASKPEEQSPALPATAPEDAEGKIPDQRPPAVEAPKPADSDSAS